MLVLCWKLAGIHASRVVTEDEFDGVVSLLVARGAEAIHAVPL